MDPQPEYSILRSCPVRPFPVALAHVLATALEHDPRRHWLTRLYRNLTWAQRAQCQAELVRCWRESFPRDVKAALAA